MNNIKNLRIAAGLSVRQLSEKSNVAVGYISMLENDTHNEKNPSKHVMERIATALKKTVQEVFYD